MVEPIPDLTLEIMSTRIDDIAGYVCFGIFDFHFGFGAGRAFGFRSCLRMSAEDPRRLTRLETSHRKLFADVCIKNAEMPDNGREESILAQVIINSNGAF